MSLFFPLIYRKCNQVTIGLWLTWCELVNVAIHTCPNSKVFKPMCTFAANKEQCKNVPKGNAKMYDICHQLASVDHLGRLSVPPSVAVSCRLKKTKMEADKRRRHWVLLKKTKTESGKRRGHWVGTEEDED
jgi:hypothetical protein